MPKIPCDRITFCESCGGEMSWGASFCQHCGSKQGQSAPHVVVPVRRPPMVVAPIQQKASGLGGGLSTGVGVGCGVVIAIVAIPILLFAMCTAGVSKVGEGLIRESERQAARERSARSATPTVDNAEADDSRPHFTNRFPIYVRILSTKQTSRSHSAVVIEVENGSRSDLRHVSVRLDAENARGRLVSSTEVMVSYLGPGATKRGEGTLLDVQASDIERIRFELDGVVGADGLRHDPLYRLVVK